MFVPLVTDVLRRLGRWESSPDADLLDRYLASRDEAAFAEIVRRHGPLVLSVSQSLLSHHQDAEDVFQAVFLVLARKAGSIRNQTSLPGWLHGVARRLALRLRDQSQRRRHRDRQALPLSPPPTAMDDLTWRELKGVLHEEVARLPEKLRWPVLLCHWQGLTHEEAARQIGCPRLTVKDRLERARALLKNRLLRRGLVPAVPLLAAWLAGTQPADAASPTLVQTTAKAALLFVAGQPGAALSRRASELAQGALKAMFANTLKIAVAASLALAALAVGTVLTVQATWPHPSARQPEPPRADTRPQAETDPLPADTLHRLGSLRFRQGKRINSVAFSSDGRTLVTSSTDSVINVWDARTGKALQRFEDKDHDLVQTATPSPDGKTLAAGYQRGRLVLFDAATGQEVARFAGLQGHVSCQLFSPDGRLLYAGEHKPAEIRCWDVATGQQRRTFAGHEGGTKNLSLSADGKLLASCGYDYHIAVYDAATGKELKRWRDPQGESSYDVALSPDGKFLAAGGFLKKVTVFEAATGKQVWQGEGHTDWIGDLAFSPDGKHLASGARDATVIVWDAATGKEAYRIKEPRNTIRLAFAPDGKSLAVATGSAVLLFDAATGKPLAPIKGHLGEVYCMAHSPDGKLLASGAQDGCIILWEVVTGKELRCLTGHPNHDVYCVAFSPDGKLLASGSNDGKVCVWSVAGEKLAVYSGHKSLVGFLHFSPDGKRLTTVDWYDDGVVVWDLFDDRGRVRAEGKQARSFRLPGGRVSAVAFSPDGKTIAAGDDPDQRFTGFGGGPSTIRLYDAATGNELKKLGGHAGGQIRGMAFSPDGKTLAVGDTIQPDGLVRLFDVATGQEVAQVKGPAERVAFSPDGRTLVTIPDYYGKHVKLFEVATGLERGRLEGHAASVMAVAFGPDGKALITASRDTTLLVWDLVGPVPKGPLSAEAFADSWKDVGDAEGLKSFRATRRIASVPNEALPHLRERLKPITADRLDKLIGELDSDQFAVRDAATAELMKVLPLAERALKKAQDGHPSLEVQRRCGRLLEQVPVYVSRLMEVLELMGTPDAHAFLVELAKGPSELRLTQEARASVKR